MIHLFQLTALKNRDFFPVHFVGLVKLQSPFLSTTDFLELEVPSTFVIASGYCKKEAIASPKIDRDGSFLVEKWTIVNAMQNNFNPLNTQIA